MTVMCVTGAMLGTLVLVGAWERWRRARAHRRIAIRVHVNGTRGKSTVARLVAAALREAGVRTLAKTTGTAARLILPDGTEQPIRRRAPASIGEQMWFLRRAERLAVGAVVVECMAVDPGLQGVSEHDMLRATIGVITNVRPDHGEVMGTTLDEVAVSLSATVPRGGVLVLGDAGGADIFTRAAAAAGTRVVQAASDVPSAAWPDAPAWWRADMATALSVARELGIPDEVALGGMARAAADPGAAGILHRVLDGRGVTILNATAANDPESLRLVVGEREGARVFVFHHRADRPYRLRQFASSPAWQAAGDRLIVTGDRPEWSTWRRVRATLPDGHVEFVPGGRLARHLRAVLRRETSARGVVYCGNTKGFSAPAPAVLLEEG